VRVEHRMDWGRTPAGKRYAVCACGWRAPARSKLTHGISDVRDHLGAVRRQCEAAGWAWWMITPSGLVTEVPDDQVEIPGVALPHNVGEV
jgi:hypothetical protein